MEHLVWDVGPDLIHLGPLRIRWYGLFFATGFLVGYFISAGIYRREGRPVENLSALFVYLIFGTLIGARLGHVLLYHPGYYLARPWEIFMIWQGGLASHGGFTGVLVAIYLHLRKYRDMSFLQLADRLAIPSLWTAAMIRIGNFFNSEILGTPSNLPWAIVFRRVDDIPRHPAMLYEAVSYFLVFCLLYTAYWKTKIADYPGRMLGVTLTTCFIARFMIEFVKEEQASFEQGMIFNMGQLLSVPFIAAGAVLIYLSGKMPARPKRR